MRAPPWVKGSGVTPKGSSTTPQRVMLEPVAMDGRRLTPLLAVLVAALAFCLAGGVASARAVRKPPASRGSTYLALGDSVTFGYQEPAVVPAPNYSNARSFIGYPQLVGRMLRLRVVNAACPGETSASFINPSAESNGCENTLGNKGGYRTKFPLHVRYKGSQLAFAIRYLRAHRQVRLVSLMIGANDVFLCQETTRDACLSPSEQNAVFTKVTRNVKRIVSAIRKKAHYRGQLAIVNYYSLNYASSLFSTVSRRVDSAEDSPAKRFGAVFADGFGEFKAATRIFAGNTCQAGLLTKLSTGGCGVHPSYAGQSLLAQALVRAIRF